jgi:cytochrome oxidase Cu insertion factor (SCO1/SenC/PrrC family)
MYTKNLFVLIICISIIYCSNKDKFTIEGTIGNAKGKMLYLEHNGLTNCTLIDSVELNEKGNYKFRAQRPQFPDFYRLLLDNKQIIFSVDSNETIIINSQYQNFAMNYSVEGSPESIIIQKLRKSLNNIQLKIDSIQENVPVEQQKTYFENLQNMIETHKDSVKKMILKNAKSLSSYFAINQQINGIPIFSAHQKDDQIYYNAVATAYHVFMPDYDRSKALYNNAINAINAKRGQQNQQNWNETFQQSSVGYIEITLPDRNGNKQSLSALAGKLVLIDFSAFDMPDIDDYLFTLKELYNNYHSRGFEIFQISLDENKILWQKQTENLPWICVRDENALFSSVAASYNVSQIPALFLLDKKGNIVSRISNLQTMEKLIRENL